MPEIKSEPGKNPVYPGEGGKSTLNSPASTYTGQYMQELYNYTNSSVFYNNSPAYLLPFYRKLQNYERWINGYVPNFHNFEQGVLPTHLAKFIVDKITNLIYGNGVTLTNSGKQTDDNIPNETMQKIGRWADDIGLNSCIQSAIRFSVGLGTGVLKLNSARNLPWVEVVPMNRCRYDYDAKGHPINASFQIQTFFQNNKNAEFGFGLFEKRFVDDAGDPFCVYSMYRLSTAVNVQQNVDPTHIGYKELPEWVQKKFKSDYGALRLDEPICLPFADIGVYPYKFTPCVSSMPHLKYGDSVLDGLNDYLCKYDQLSAAIDTEVYCGRARVWAKKSVQNRARGNFNAGIDSFMFTEYESIGNTEQPLQFFQPQIRTEELRGIRNIILEDICTAIGIAPSSFASFLQDGTARTAREISAEENATTLFVANHRTGIVDAVNRLLDAVCGYFGLPDRVQVQFSQAGQTNYTLLVENVTKMHSAGIMSLETAVKMVNPTMDEEQIAAEIEKIKQEQKEKSDREKQNLWDFGDTEAISG